jgi:hypothetical protein
MRVRIVSYEDVNAWILGKFARRMNEELLKLGVDSDISNVPDPSADINHHLIFTYCMPEDLNSKDTLMVTHVDEISKSVRLKNQLKRASLGICMSKGTMDELIAIGIPADRLSFVNAAHDNVMRPRRTVIGITSKVQPTGCKREEMIFELAETLDPSLFEFVIMGSGWESIIVSIRNLGIHVTYYDTFQYEKYVEIMPSFDYYLYTGQDEGSMGFIDALAAGVKTIVTPQGFHLDATNGITHSFNTIEELKSIFGSISSERLKLLNAVADWTWKDYAIKHLELWKHITGKGTVESQYKDGLNSLLNRQPAEINVKAYKKSLYNGSIRSYRHNGWRKMMRLGDPKWLMQKLRSQMKAK